MQQEINQQRIQSMYQMLLEMGSGNFTNRIERTEQDDELEALVVLVNMVAEEMKESVFHSGFINPHYTYKNLVQTSFILDTDFIIRSYNSAVPLLLGFSDERLHNTPFSSILSKESLPIWDSAAVGILHDEAYNSILPLAYITHKQLLVPCFCTISRLKHSTSILISSVTTVIDETLLAKALVSVEDTNLLSGFSSYADVQLIQHVYDYILKHLDSPLPSLKELSQIFGTNDNKLKQGFKLLFKTSIYQFYTNERLKRAHLLIQQTTIPLKRIATIMGFNTYPNFSRAFKKHFDYAPNEVERR
ncbi:helix-turn-helix domain-containing protein [Flavobacterium gawalongense]|uniref:Helix-turn-helix domain-containing protein n=1 Tax=Flavobacterium gawalongense TaxID=2594432 RepID=A0ABY3CPY5_9FLAO|nr:AraC family transcriptional regulator [Flavobacterium gawalongense]TRW99020.1 helix-turn-helix domain-containing protein [Flavobacterium gawalongense]TRX09915.1 helix-turn-helix domain-containing protein [Flavobacterium gawalongense]